MSYLRSLTCRYDGGMRPLAIVAATIMGATTFIAWCAARAGSRPTPQPPVDLKMRPDLEDTIARFQRLADEARKRGEL